MASLLICRLSGAPISDPVVSTITGDTYERSSIEKYIELNGTDPITGEAMDKANIVSLKCNLMGFSKPVQSTGVPS